MGQIPKVDADIESVTAQIEYLSSTPRVSRPFVAPTGGRPPDAFEKHRLRTRNGRPFEDQFSLDTHGFVLARHSTAVKDFHDKAEVDAVYPAEAEELVEALTGADLVVPLGWNL